MDHGYQLIIGGLVNQLSIWIPFFGRGLRYENDDTTFLYKVIFSSTLVSSFVNRYGYVRLANAFHPSPNIMEKCFFSALIYPFLHVFFDIECVLVDVYYPSGGSKLCIIPGH